MRVNLMIRDPDGKLPEPEDGDPVLALEEEDGEDEEGDGDDQASLALNTPEPARAKMASMPPKEKIKGNAGKNKFKKDKGDAKAGVDVKLSDAALGLSESEGEKPEEEEDKEQSAFDRDEITDPDLEDTVEENIDPLAILVGSQSRPWQNEKLSLMERMTMRDGYNRNTDEIDKDKQDKDDPKAKGKKAKGPDAVKTVTATAAVVAVAAGAAVAADNKSSGPSMTGISSGPRRQADQDHAVTGSDAIKQNKTEQIKVEARQNAADITMKHIDKGLASSFAMHQRPPEPASKANMDWRDYAQPEEQWNNDAGAQLQADNINWSPAQEADAEFQARMNELMMAIGYDNLSPITPYREEMWGVKLMEYNENSADLTTAPEPPAPTVPAPDLTYKQEPSINFGPGGMG